MAGNRYSWYYCLCCGTPSSLIEGCSEMYPGDGDRYWQGLLYLLVFFYGLFWMYISYVYNFIFSCHMEYPNYIHLCLCSQCYMDISYVYDFHLYVCLLIYVVRRVFLTLLKVFQNLVHKKSPTYYVGLFDLWFWLIKKSLFWKPIEVPPDAICSGPPPKLICTLCYHYTTNLE